MKKRRDLIQYGLFVGIIILLNVLGSLKFFRFDLTAEKRYTLAEASVQLLETAEDPILVKVYLEGNFPAGFQRLQQETQQILDEFRAYNPRLQYEFVNPATIGTEEEVRDFQQQLQYKGLKPYRLSVKEKGENSVKTIFPGALVSYGTSEVPVLLLKDQLGVSPEQQINSSIENLEFAFLNAFRALLVEDKPSVAFIQGHGELGAYEVADLAKSLSANYQTDLFNLRKFKSDSTGEELSITQQQTRLNRFDAIIIAKPQKAFTDLDKFLIDQYVMTGGKVVWLLDGVTASMDSLSEASQFMSLPLFDRLNLNDLLFKYGVRINNDLLTDMVAAGVNDQREVRPWIYFPMIMPQSNHPIAKDLNAIWLQFASSLDTVMAAGIKKTILLRSSPYSARLASPAIVSLRDLYQPPPQERFRERAIPLAVLLEGEFSSLYENRVVPREGGSPLRLVPRSKENQMVVVADGDLTRNQLNVVNPNIPKGAPLPLGYDQYTGMQYGNKDFMVNVLDYLLDQSGLISIRSRELKIRLLDLNRAEAERMLWQVINTAVPLSLVLIFGLLNTFWRRRKYLKA